jgi:uncharacterized protein YndB with AHSA1/START domain
MKTTMPLARFLNRYTMVYERTYPHPIERVWEAVSTAEHLDVWMLPFTKVERRVGGRASFTFGSPADTGPENVVTTFDPPNEIQYTGADEPRSFRRFQLATVAMGTQLTFTLAFAPGQQTSEEKENDVFGADRPAGGDTPWRPGFVAGFHGMLDTLGRYLAGEWSLEDTNESLHRYLTEPGIDEDELALHEVYRQHIAKECPPA